MLGGGSFKRCAHLKKTLFLLPGLLCDRTVWVHQVAALSGIADVRVADFRGYRSFEDMARSVVREAPARFSVTGHSMGARVAFEVFRQAGERVERLAILDTGIHPVAEGERSKRKAFLETARLQGMKALADMWIPGMVHPAKLSDAEFTGMISDMVQGYTLKEFEGQIEALLNRADLYALVPLIRCPTLVACGRQDAWAPPHQHEEMVSLIPHARLEIIENCGHMSTMEQPEAVSGLLRDWLTETGR